MTRINAALSLYNDVNPYAIRWLTNLIQAGHVADGHVTAKSVLDLTPGDLHGVSQFHAFAGIGVWSLALRLAGWQDAWPVWTGSCPCQPFSAAGKGLGINDDRHLWPAWFRLIDEHYPPFIFGEQVSSPDGRAWFDAVSTDLEGAGYAVEALDTCAAGVGAPHIRQRLYFVAVADAGRARRQGGPWAGAATGSARRGRRMDDPDRGGRHGPRLHVRQGGQEPTTPEPVWTSQEHWSPVEWIYCSDGKYRPVEPGVCPVAPRTTADVEQLRAYGNGLNLGQAATFVRAVMDIFL